MFTRVSTTLLQRASVRHGALTAATRMQAYRPRLMAASFHASSRFAASASDPFQSASSHPVMQKIGANPKVMEQLAEFTMLLQKKGIDVQGKQPGFSEMMKIMNDPEIKASVQKLAQEMQAAGIQLDMQTIAEIQNSLEDVKKEQGNDSQDGVMNKMKGFFKK
ncbi:hypothetical protein RO3G_06883 [Lichtheimia corymbifera JMRC:FSU:9682]|uniref:Uncharacterized protein n=1 Tax=Lichtheimia corymbifera JMRC:FSU:9682 TaxID=1263082 RepID=A0A068SC70_9FUNG|nr:hypothetical protein RO3G_06883 [Lichtheimia corymbifera JMRC:FSU:9682]